MIKYIQLQFPSQARGIRPISLPPRPYLNVDRWQCVILEGQLEILTLISLVWQLCELNGQQ